MNNYRPINTGEGELYLAPGIESPSPFEKLRICNCGAITFLDGPCRICKRNTMKPISKTLEKQFYSDMNEQRRSQWILLVLSVVLTVLYLVVMMIMIGNSSTYGIGTARKVFLIIIAILLTMQCILGVFQWFESVSTLIKIHQHKFGNQVIASYVLAFCDSPFVKKGSDGGKKRPWLNMVLNQYREDISYLIMQFTLACKSRTKESDLPAVYYAALKLSYIMDSKELIELRLQCLKEIGLHQNAHSDIEQILHVLPAEYFREKPNTMYMVEKCLENYSEPLSKWTVCCLMNDLRCFMEVSGDRDIVKKCLLHCSGGSVSWFFKNYREDWAAMAKCVAEVAGENEVFKQQISATWV